MKSSRNPDQNGPIDPLKVRPPRSRLLAQAFLVAVFLPIGATVAALSSPLVFLSMGGDSVRVSKKQARIQQARTARDELADKEAGKWHLTAVRLPQSLLERLDGWLLLTGGTRNDLVTRAVLTRVINMQSCGSDSELIEAIERSAALRREVYDGDWDPSAPEAAGYQRQAQVLRETMLDKANKNVKQFPLRLPVSLLKRADDLCDVEKVSRNDFFVLAIQDLILDLALIQSSEEAGIEDSAAAFDAALKELVLNEGSANVNLPSGGD